MARVELERVNKVYPARHGAVHAVQDLDLTIHDGEFVALLGPSGCGKTSTLRMIVGLEAISGGEIRFDGKRVNELSPGERNVAMAFETYALYPNFTVAENLAFPLESRGVPAADRSRAVDRIAQLLRIEDILKAKPGALSGGQQQRVSLGRALIREPAVFILDEVMSHLDAHLKFQMLFDLKKLHHEVGRTMVYVTHDQMEALALADRVAVMSVGRLEQFGSRDELYHAPASRFVADFIGEPPTNFFPAEALHEADRSRLEVQGADMRFWPDAARKAALRDIGDTPVVVGIRPQNISLRPSDGEHALTAEVMINEYVGERVILTMKSGTHVFQVLAPPRTDARPGAVLSLYYRASDVMVFDAATDRFVG